MKKINFYNSLKNTSNPLLVNSGAVVKGMATVGVAFAVVSLIGSLPLLVIAPMAIQGTVSGAVVGGILAGTGGAFTLAGFLASGALFDKKHPSMSIASAIVTILAAGYLVMGILGCVGVLSGFTVGWVFCGTLIVLGGIPVLASSCGSSIGIARGITEARVKLREEAMNEGLQSTNHY